VVGERFTPLPSVGVYAPARKGPLVSTVLMLAGAARVAGVPRIAVASPPVPGGGWDRTTFAAARLAGADEFYVGNGVAIIAAFTFGTESIAPVDGVFGPGPPGIAAAMGLAGSFGRRAVVGIGPTDCMVMADASADPSKLALDLMSEAEHGPDSSAMLITTSGALAEQVRSLLEKRLPEAVPARRAHLAHVFGELGLGALVVVTSWDEGLALATEFAPEHLMLVGPEPERLAKRIASAGELLLGEDCPFAAANYAIGITAVLPTNGSARRISGVTARDMVRMTTTARLERTALDELTPTIAALAHSEGLWCHAIAVAGRP
jgi:histidinol dehydrogenase